MPVRLSGTTSGYTELSAPAVAGNNTLTLPTGNGTADQALVTNGSGALSWSDRGRMTLATAQNSTSGTAIDFTSIPSWVKRVTVMFNGVSTNGTSSIRTQLGTSSGIVSTGYAGTCSFSGSSGAGGAVFSSGVDTYADNTASVIRRGSLIFSVISGNTWIVTGIICSDVSSFTMQLAGSVALPSTLDRIRITTVNGTDTFDAGSINILYEG